MAMLSNFRETAEVVDGVMPRGSALLFDSRTFHRGLGNTRSDGADRYVLVLRWDPRGRPPPGVNAAGTFLNRGLGWLLEKQLLLENERNGKL